ncbi:hypothetical protein ACWDX6_21295 [Streptomyces sp. NPDC003027]
MRISQKALIAVGIAAFFPMLNPSVASAAYYGDETDYTVNYVPEDKGWEPALALAGVKASFAPNGDYFRVADTKSDGRAAAVQWYDGASGRTGTCVNKLGAGSDGSCNKNFPEGHHIQFRAALYDAGELVAVTYDWTSAWS